MSDAVRRCRVCGCTDDNCYQCIARTGAPCHWVKEDLCSVCFAFRTDLALKNMEDLVALVRAESERQIQKWGIQTRTPEEWELFLTEEVGELAQAVAEVKYRSGDPENIVKEGIQVATLALKIVEMELVRVHRSERVVAT